MKKVIVILFIIMLVVLLSKDTKVMIPKNSIRFRIIANSNLIKDQEQKQIIKKDIETELYKITNNATDINETRALIQNNIPIIKEKINKYTNNYNLSFGMNYFPKKYYKGLTYEEGNYESLVITLGKGLGENWWCVLFPPLCLLEVEEKNINDVNYSFYIKEILNKYM